MGYMERVISEKELENLKRVKGKIRGFTMKSYIAFILKNEGVEAVKKVEDFLKKIGYPIKPEDLRPMGFYSLDQDAAVLLAIKKLFNYDSKKFQEIGMFGATFITIARIFAEYFVSLNMLSKNAPQMWERIVTTGKFNIIKLDKKEKHLIAVLKDANIHELHCFTLKGYFSAVSQMVLKKPVTLREVKCSFRGDAHHEFSIEW